MISFAALGKYAIAGIAAAVALAVTFSVVRRWWRGRERRKHLKYKTRRRALGVVFGKTPWRLVCSPEKNEGHVAVFGGTGSGKTAALLIPTLRAWLGAAFVLDISGDIAANVPGEKIIFEPENPDTVPWNVFFSVDSAETEAQKNEILMQLAFILIPSAHGDSDITAFYKGESRKILQASLIAYYYANKDFIEICKLIVGLDYETLIADITASGNELAGRLVASLEGVNERTMASTKAELDNSVMLTATNENIMRSCRRSDKSAKPGISPATLEKSSVYIVIPDIKLELWSPLFRLITAQTLEYLAGRENGKQPPILLCLDEFSSLGKLEILPALRKLRKKNVRILVSTQSLLDLDMNYGTTERKAMLDNFAFKVVLSATEVETQRYFSDLAGEYTKTKISQTVSAETYTESYSEQREKIIHPEEFSRLGKDLVLFYPGGVMRLRKNFYFKSRGYTRRAAKQTAKEREKAARGNVREVVKRQKYIRQQIKRGELVRAFDADDWRVWVTPSDAKRLHEERESRWWNERKAETDALLAARR